MKIRVLYFDDCPSYQPAVETIREALAETSLAADIELVNIESSGAGAACQFFGSPTIQINGVDLEGLTGQTEGLGCRVYNEGGQIRGWPSKEMIRKALLGTHHIQLPLKPARDCCSD